jgi:hypothetical protein
MGKKTDWLLGRTPEQKEKVRKAREDLRATPKPWNGLVTQQTPKKDRKDG